MILRKLFGFGSNKNNTVNTLNSNHEIKKLLESLKSGMIAFIESGEGGYTKKDVYKCITLLNAFLSDLSQSGNKDEGMTIVKDVVLKINELNENCGEELIETEEREQIAKIIITAGYLKGYNTRDEDITEEWREW